jgi:hypothetical protein
MDDVDCMACLVAMAKGLPEGGTHVDAGGVTHATMRAQHRTVLTCTVSIDPYNPGRGLMARAQTVPR